MESVSIEICGIIEDFNPDLGDVIRRSIDLKVDGIFNPIPMVFERYQNNCRNATFRKKYNENPIAATIIVAFVFTLDTTDCIFL